MNLKIKKQNLNPKLISIILFVAIFIIINLLRYNSSMFFPDNESYVFINELESYKKF